MPVPLVIPLIAVAAAVGIGYAVSTGLVADHMAPADGSGGVGSLGTAPDCIETLDKLPTGSSDVDNLRNAAKKAYLTAASSADAMFLKTFAGELDAQGFHDAASCMRARAASIEATLTAVPKGPGVTTATTIPTYLTGGPALATSPGGITSASSFPT